MSLEASVSGSLTSSNEEIQEVTILTPWVRTRYGIALLWRTISLLLMPVTFLAYLFPRGLRPATTRGQHELSSTAYLDALRGYAAYIVYNGHVINPEWRPETGWIMQFPWAKIWFRGHGMVDLFFIISGYALSYRVLVSIHAKQHIKVLDSLASSTLRRYLRLFIPTAVASFVAMVAISTGLATKGEDPQVLQPTLLGNLQFWIVDTSRASSPFQHVVGWWYGGCFGTQYLPQMWTIPVEFRGSVILFMFLAATCRMRTKIRLYVTWICIITFFWWDASYAGEFLMGMWVADLKLHRTRQQQSQPSSPVLLVSPISSLTYDGTFDEEKQLIPGPSSRLATSLVGKATRLFQGLPFVLLFVISIFICSLILLTAPEYIDTNSQFPFNLIAMLIPPNYNYAGALHIPLALGAFMMVYSLDNSPLLQKPLLLPVSQYIGELSFGIYAMHNTIRWIVWEDHLVKWQEMYFGDKHDFWQLLPGYLLMTVLVIWAAEFFRRVDMRVVAWTKMLQDLCFEKK